MSHVWGARGLAFEYPTSYRVENRVLTLRAGVLVLMGLALWWLTATDPPSPSVTQALSKIERGSLWPHVLAGLLLIGLGVVDLVRLAGQQRILLGEGEPAPMAAELPLQASGASSGGHWLYAAIDKGTFEASTLGGNYRALLWRIAPLLAHAPIGLQAFLRVRVAQLMFSLGLALLLVLAWVVAPNSQALPVVALLVTVLLVGHVVYCAWIAEDAPGPIAEASMLAAAAVGTIALLWLGPKVPQVSLLQAAALPLAALALLSSMVVIESLALLAGRAQADMAPQIVPGPNEALAEFNVSASRLVETIDDEMIRRWTDGVPNRRFIRKLPLNDAEAALGGIVLEEAQPTLPAKHRERLPPQTWHRKGWLLVLAVLGISLTTTGGAMWVWMASALLHSAAAPWVLAVTAAVLVLVGGYAVRVGHLAWSRVEVGSALHLLEFRPATSMGRKGAVEEQVLRLRVRAMQVRSVFFAAAKPRLGSRRPVSMSGDAPSAQKFVEQLGYFLDRAGSTLESKARKTVLEAAQAKAAPPITPIGTPRFCSACGTPCPHGARFCLSCGKLLAT